MKKQNIYMIGIKGVGMTMLAQFLVHQGYQVSGSDVEDIFLTDKVLKSEGIKIYSPFRIDNIPDQVDLIIYSSAFNVNNNVELKEVKKRGIKMLSYAEALGETFNQYKGIAVCGSHGKTSVSAWLGYVLFKANKKPNVLVGSRVPQFKGSGLQGKSKLFVAEVDEYQNKLQYFNPYGVVLNNIDFDHPDFFSSPQAYTNVFKQFIKKIPENGFLVINNQDKEIRKIKKYCQAKIISYAVEDSSEVVNYLAYNIKEHKRCQKFQVNNLGEFKIKLWGKHNIANALAVIASARELGVSLKDIKKYLAEFKGTERRAQLLGKYKGADIIDDYAHHPVEIKATLEGIKKHYRDKKIITVFHPHTYTRTKALFNDFVTSFNDSDELIVLDIYSSAREKKGGVSSKDLVEKIKKYNRDNNCKQKVLYVPSLDEVAKMLRKKLDNDQVLILMGAGDVFRVGKKLLKK